MLSSSHEGYEQVIWKFRHNKQTLARSLFSERNTSRFLISFSSCMSRGKSKVCSRHPDTNSDLPFWASLRVASDVTGSPVLSTKAGF